MIHVSVISGSLLASNNPSSASIIRPKKRETLSRTEQTEDAQEKFHMEDRIQGRIDAFFLSLSHNSRLKMVNRVRAAF